MKRLGCLLAFGFLAAPVQAQLFWPMLSTSSPCAIQIGTTTECVFNSSNGDGTGYKVLVVGPGVTGEVAPPKTVPGAKSQLRTDTKVRFTVAPGAPTGIRDVRLLTPTGPTSLGQIVVVRDPVVREKNPNGSMKEAQPFTLPAALCGAIENKVDVDYFKFQVKAGAAVTFHMICQRLENKLCPLATHARPMITLRNASGTVLAANDHFFSADPLLHYRFAIAGEYYLEVRDVRYDGFRFWEYVIEAHERPFVTAISPACLSPGVPTKVKLIGSNLPPDPYLTVTLPADAPAWDQWLQLPDVAGQPANAVPIRPCPLPVVHEVSGANETLAQAQALNLPAAVAGVIDRDGDVDCYAFQAKKGERFTFEIAARPLNSELDSVLRILGPKGETLAENDDASERTDYPEARNVITTPDSRIENWEAPADGRFVIEVTDSQGRGGERCTYSLIARKSQPFFRLELTCDRTVLAPGVGGVIFVRSVRKEGFKGDIQLSIEGLPPGVTAECGPIPANCQDGCILLFGDSAKPQAFGSVRIFGTAMVQGADKSVSKQIVQARPFGELMVEGGGRALVPVDDHVVAVSSEVDIKAIRFSPAEITLKPGETKKVEVSIERRPGFTEPVSLTVTSMLLGTVFGNCMPAGVTLDPSSQLRLTGGQLKGALVFKAAPNAKTVERQLVPIVGEVSVNFTLRMYYAGAPFRLTVEAPPPPPKK